MKWTNLLVIAAIIVIFFMLKRAGQVSAKDALAYLKRGALVIDVRSHGEFSAGHLPDTINIPLEEIKTALPAQVEDKSRVLLLHCRSGMRSGLAQRELKSLGHTNTFNLGSYGRAESILNQR